MKQARSWHFLGTGSMKLHAETWDDFEDLDTGQIMQILGDHAKEIGFYSKWNRKPLRGIVEGRIRVPYQTNWMATALRQVNNWVR